FNLTTGKLIDINVTRSGTETTRGIDMTVTDTSTGGDISYFKGDSTSTSGIRQFFDVSMEGNGADVTAFYSYVEAQSSGNSAYGADLTAVGFGNASAFGILAAGYDKTGEAAANIHGGFLGVVKFIAGTTAIALELNAAGPQTADKALKLSGAFVDGIDLSTATLTHAIKMGNTQTFYDGTYSLTVANAWLAYWHVTSNGATHTYINQNVTTAASPTFADLTLSAPVNIYALSHNSFANYVANEHIDWTGATQSIVTTGDAQARDITATRKLKYTIKRNLTGNVVFGRASGAGVISAAIATTVGTASSTTPMGGGNFIRMPTMVAIAQLYNSNSAPGFMTVQGSGKAAVNGNSMGYVN
ncbi:hypothetical protein LCGC14_3036160, partial [marine sediment metagenome]